MKILFGFASDLAKKSGDPPRGVSGGSPDDFRRDNIDGSHGSKAIVDWRNFRCTTGVYQRLRGITNVAKDLLKQIKLAAMSLKI